MPDTPRADQLHQHLRAGQAEIDQTWGELHEAEIAHKFRGHQVVQELTELGVVGSSIHISSAEAEQQACHRGTKTEDTYNWRQLTRPLPLDGKTGFISGLEIANGGIRLEITLVRGHSAAKRICDKIIGQQQFKFQADSADFRFI